MYGKIVENEYARLVKGGWRMDNIAVDIRDLSLLTRDSQFRFRADLQGHLTEEEKQWIRQLDERGHKIYLVKPEDNGVFVLKPENIVKGFS